MQGSMKLTGGRELARVLRAMPERVAQAELEQALRAGANVIRKEAVARAPRSGDPESVRAARHHGKRYPPLHKAIRVTKMRGAARRTAHLVVHTGAAFWALFLEFGTRRMAPHPFFTAAFDAAAGPALQRLGKRLGAGIERRSRELAGRYGALRKATKRRL